MAIHNIEESPLRSLLQDLSSSLYKLLRTFLFDRAWELGAPLKGALNKFDRLGSIFLVRFSTV